MTNACPPSSQNRNGSSSKHFTGVYYLFWSIYEKRNLGKAHWARCQSEVFVLHYVCPRYPSSARPPGISCLMDSQENPWPWQTLPSAHLLSSIQTHRNHVKHLLPQNDGAALNKTQALNVCNIMHLYPEMKVTPGLVPGLIIYNIILFLQRVQSSSSSIRSSALYINLTTKLFLITQHQEMLTRVGFCRNLRDELCYLVGKRGQASVLQLRQAHLGTWGWIKHLKELFIETTTGKSTRGAPERKTL